MIKPSTIQAFLCSAKAPSLGSLGETIFDHFASQKYKNIESSHVELCDFIIDGQKVDVKTTAKYLKSDSPPDSSWKGKRIPGVQYATVCFYRYGVKISIESNAIATVSWSNLDKIYNDWSSGYYKRKESSQKSKQSKRLSSDIKDNIKDIFKRAHLSSPYILHRTVMFSGESPHNLLPTQRIKRDQKGWTVFLVFSSAPPIIDSLKEIIAFPDSIDSSLPRIQKNKLRLHIKNLEKADLSLIPKRYKFRNLESIENYLRQNT